MKKIVFLLVFSCVCLVCCVAQRQASACRYTNAQLLDSIQKLNARPVMTVEQFVRLYKYERLNRYYRICKRKPSQWKYYKGWSIRVFEGK